MSFTVALFANRETVPELVPVNDWQELQEVVGKFFNGRGYTDREWRLKRISPWMNRLWLEGQDYHYHIAPKLLRHDGNFAVATDHMFAVLRYNDKEKEFAEMTQEDVEAIKEALAKAMTPEEQMKYSMERDIQIFYGCMFQTYRAIYDSSSDEFAARLLDMLQNNPDECWRWIDVASRGAVSTLELEADKKFCKELTESQFLCVAFAAAEHHDSSGIYTLSHALASPKLKEELIRALEPECRKIYRGER